MGELTFTYQYLPIEGYFFVSYRYSGRYETEYYSELFEIADYNSYEDMLMDAFHWADGVRKEKLTHEG